LAGSVDHVDGYPDIVVSNCDGPAYFVRNRAAARNNWIALRLRGRKSNRDGLGATVRVHAGKQVYAKFHDGKSGHLSQSSLPLYFGLADAQKIDRIEVTWPSGRKQVVTKGLRINKILRITEPK